MAPKYYLNDFDEKYSFMDDDGHRHDIPLRNLTADELLRVVKFYRLQREPDWNRSVLTEKLRAAMPKWDGDMRNLDHAVRWHWRDRIMQARPIRDV
jgi:hypothetical protein